jgi:hypothetical protein
MTIRLGAVRNGGVRVDLAELDDYASALVETQQIYDQIKDQLTAADLTDAARFESLVGKPQYDGPQREFTDACRELLATYRDLYTQIHDLNGQISGKLNYMVQAFVDTSTLYRQQEVANTTLYQDLLSERGR